MILRKASLSDLDAIMKIEEASFIPQIQEDREVFKQRILRCPELFLVFEDEILENKKIAGYLCAEEMIAVPKNAEELKLGHIPSVSQNYNKRDRDNCGKNHIYISSFALLPEYRGGGNGKQMWNSSMEYFKKQFSPYSLLLLVNELWSGAKHIYSDCGFTVTKIFENFFPRGDGSFSNGILMENLLE